MHRHVLCRFFPNPVSTFSDLQRLDAQLHQQQMSEAKVQIAKDFADFLEQAQRYGPVSLWDITAIIEERFKQETSPCTGRPLTCYVVLRDVQEANGWY